MKTLYFIVGVVIVTMAAVYFIVWSIEPKNCHDFSNQKEAQNALIRDPKKYDVLDRDHDGTACDHML